MSNFQINDKIKNVEQKLNDSSDVSAAIAVNFKYLILIIYIIPPFHNFISGTFEGSRIYLPVERKKLKKIRIALK
jgi:hypothetical protein